MKTPFARTLLTEEDWNFAKDQVPNKELAPCLLWELLRESATVLKLKQDWSDTKRDDQDRQAELFARMQALTLNLNHKFNKYDFMVRVMWPGWTFQKLENGPWQKLPPERKKWLTEPFENVNEPTFIGYENHVVELAKAMSAASPAKGEMLVRARAPLRFFTSGPNCEGLCIVVDWGRYDNNAIKRSWEKLGDKIIKSRPKGIKPQVRQESGRGNPNELRGKLNSLGRTRLYCYYDGVAALKRANLSAHQWLLANTTDKGDRAVMQTLSAAKDRFIDAFHEILPFENGKLPLCVASSRFNR